MNKNKIIWIIGGVAVIIVVAYFVFAGLWPNTSSAPAGVQTNTGTVTPSGIVAATGTSAIASSGIVVSSNGQPTENNVTPAAPTAPQQSAPITNTASIPSAAIKLTVSIANGFTPNAFTVSAGAAITISITSGDQYSHVFAFKDSSLSAVAVGVGPGETRAITFNAPTKAGTYDFYSNVPGQSGEAGVMTVK